MHGRRLTILIHLATIVERAASRPSPYAGAMPRPLTERQRWQQELDELPAQITGWEKELAALPPGERRREMYDWMIRRDRLRMETLRKWLARTAGELE